MKKEAFEKLLESIHQGGSILKGEMKPKRVFNLKHPDVKAIRSQLGFSQDQFARLMGIKVGTLRNWEQGRRDPKGPARLLLGVAATHPDALVDVARFKSSKGKKGRNKLAA